jgi:DNA-binding MarR family transcriptional regulator/GNAT superfamily N-acetyltransferase
VDAVVQVRRFNRAVTQRIGALGEHYMSRTLSLPQSRVLWEIGVEGVEVRTLRTRLGLDAGYLSRILSSLEDAGLVRLEASARDRRIRVARLTKRGLRERAGLDARSDELAASMLSGLPAQQRDQLLDAMRTVERLLVAGSVSIQSVDPSSDPARFCIASYFAELERRSGHRLAAATRTAAEPHELICPRGRMRIALRDSEPVGCGAVKFNGDGTCDIKRMWVSESARGARIGWRMLAELESLATRRKCTVARLETNKTLVEAIAMYKRAGYVEVAPFNDEPFADHWFEKRLV